MDSNVIIFYDESFPYEGQKPPANILETLKGKANIVNAAELAEVLENHEAACFIHLHGAYFPKSAWGSIVSFLKKGKGLVSMGGRAPFRKPCNLVNGEWVAEREQTAYHAELNIHEVLKVKQTPIEKLVHTEDFPLFKGYEELFTIQDTGNFILHPTKASSIEHEMGSVGPMDARIYPLLKGVSKNGREVAAPSVVIENYKGPFTGGRWVFINQLVTDAFWNALGCLLLQDLADFTARGVTELWLKTNYAAYQHVEVPIITFQAQSLRHEQTDWDLELTLSKEGLPLESLSVAVTITKELHLQPLLLQKKEFDPGLYELRCRLVNHFGEERILRQGFWFMDKALLESGHPLICERDYFLKNNQPFPVVGMTYMTSDVARYFLFLPNSSVWNKDFAAMKAAGINYVRTGIWTAWRNMMFIDGHMEESILRAIDAFILTAKQHDIELTFNFFSFTPEEWEGKNPYLDPRSVEAQKRFITGIVARHRTTTNVHWDLINEPSLFNPKQTFSGPRTLHDAYDTNGYREWLKQRHSDIAVLQERWNMTPNELPSFDAAIPPAISEINTHIQDMASGKKGLKWLDYTLYTMDKHNEWIETLSQSIRNLSKDQLITVGQDEALMGQRPSPFFYGKAVDYTTNHSWWSMDNLLWDGIFAKTLDKPNLIQETGIMYVEQPNNQAKRSEEELRNILERKYAYAFATGNAGAVQWLWNTNYFMNNINESNIGALRADGTEKPEANVSYDFGRFMNKIGPLFVKRKLEDVVVIFPYSNDFSNRRLAFEATTKLTRVLAYELNQPFRALSEYDVTGLAAEPPKLIIVPSPHNFSSKALAEIIDFVKIHDVTLLFTGPVSLDEYWNETCRMKDITGPTKLGNVLREEMLLIGSNAVPISFGDKRIAEVVKEGNEVKEFSVGKGTIIWSPLPVELNERNQSIYDLYQFALHRANIDEHLSWHSGNVPGVYGRKLEFEAGKLFIFVSEFGMDITVTITDPDTEQTYEFILESERSVLFATSKTGEIIGTYREDEVKIKTKRLCEK
ncbi:glycoside hydrolase family protein [Neobacillus bataviensis LMG 21833]|uniref:Glycoside hydrolase family protein n=1 Tax=Neobacillus bataviensis LMG 21833 TaxID=1117379 RepID=K6DWJ3_9BACI|nr:beta-galactosidase [Neobacillus bataviensis]EKN65231.1 glycoside hydrolase family protein [Neobacillus bataviensis LMG 21833]